MLLIHKSVIETQVSAPEYGWTIQSYFREQKKKKNSTVKNNNKNSIGTENLSIHLQTAWLYNLWAWFTIGNFNSSTEILIFLRETPSTNIRVVHYFRKAEKEIIMIKYILHICCFKGHYFTGKRDLCCTLQCGSWTAI